MVRQTFRLQSIWQATLPYFNWVGILLVSVVGFIGLHLLRNPQRLANLGLPGLISIGILGTWRWSWTGLQLLRGCIYQRWVFPRWRRRSQSISIEQLPPVCFLVPTYKEQPWITERVFRAIAQEAKSLTQPLTLLVSSGSDEENAAIRTVLQSVDPDLSSICLIQSVQTGEGKRQAMADGLRELARLNLPQDTVVALMDGDSELTLGTLHLCLPFFRMFPRLGALTTDELPIVKGSYLFSEWFHLRMVQRHYHMCSISLSQKVTCLTGRFSLFLSEAALHPTFADQLESDTLDDWLWGKFKFLSGDDKSTWFWLLQRGYDMIYVPDVTVYSIETISGSLVSRAYQNMRRWYGNMLRNNGRAISLGPNKTGWFLWYCLIDQRLSMWTSLTTPGLLLIYLLQAKWTVVGIIISWILTSRPLYLAAMFWGRRSHLKPIHFPLLLVSMWGASLVKIWTQMNLAQQKWYNRGNQIISAAGSGWVRWAKIGTSRYLYASQILSFVVILFWLSNLVSPVDDLAGLWWYNHVSVQSVPTQTIEATDYGLVPDDRQDDSAPLIALMSHLPSRGRVQINLPIGEIDLFYPLNVHRSRTIIKGRGIGRTVLQAHFNREVGEAILTIRPGERRVAAPNKSHTMFKNMLHDVHLNGFTVSHVRPQQASASASTVDSIVLEKVRHASLKNLDLEKSNGHSLVLHQTQDVTVEYVAMDVDRDRDNTLVTVTNSQLSERSQQSRHTHP